MNFKLSDTVNIPLKVSMWVRDEDRLDIFRKQRENSIIWDLVSIVWLCHLNACRYSKTEAQTNTDELELRIDELFSTLEGKKYIAEFSTQIKKEVEAINEMPGEEKKSQPAQIAAKKKKPTGKR